LYGISQNKPLCEAEQCSIYIFFPSSYLQHALHRLVGYCFLPFPPPAAAAAVVSDLHLLKSVEGLLG